MCGIAGIFNDNNLNEKNFLELLKVLNHRGPDQIGTYFDKDGKIIIGNTRLAIQDLDKTGNLPMTSFTKNLVICYNGEIYNFLNLKKKIEKDYKIKNKNFYWKSSSDTEVLVNGIELYGINKMLNAVEGMFAFAIWNITDQTLTLSRDLCGEKPLFYGIFDNIFYFASELKFFKKKLKEKLSLNHESARQMLHYSFVPCQNTIYNNIQKIKPGEFIQVDKDIKIKKSFFNTVNNLVKNNNLLLKNNENILNDFDTLLNEKVNLSKVSDVKVASFLSGGIDSSLISYYLQKNSSHKIDTYTMYTDDALFDESVNAKKISTFIGSNHHEFKVEKLDVIKFVENMHDIYCEPFADSSQIPTFLITKNASFNSKVILSGDGGDELFGGYNRYLFFENYLKSKNLYNNTFVKKIFSIFNKFAFSKLDIFFEKLPMNKFWRTGSKIDKFLDAVRGDDILKIYNNLLISSNLVYDNIPNAKVFNFLEDSDLTEIKSLRDIMKIDINFYLNNDILSKVDMASMSNSIEVRSPFLNPSLIKFADSLPLDLRIKSYDKSIIKQLFLKNFNKNLLQKQKKGFSVPLEKYLRTFLRDWAYDLLDKKKLNDHKLFDTDKVLSLWDSFQNSKGNLRRVEYFFWNILVFQNWYFKSFLK